MPLIRRLIGCLQPDGILRDLRHSFRVFMKYPGVTAVVVGCLGLGIGANTAIFSVMNAVMLRMLPVEAPERLVQLGVRSDGPVPREIRRTSSGYGSRGQQFSFSYSAFEHLRRHSRTLEGVAGYVPIGFQASVTVQRGGQTTVARGEMVSGNFFEVVGTRAGIGRIIEPGDENAAAPRVAVLRHGYWVREMGGERSVIGQPISLNRVAYTVIGVAPPEFYGVNAALPPDIWIPLREEKSIGPWGVRTESANSLFHDKGWWWLMMVGRLRPGVTAEAAKGELTALFHANLLEGIGTIQGRSSLPILQVNPAAKGMETLRERFSEPLQILMGVVGVVLLIACANVAILLLARASARRKEIGVRLAVGASRWQVMRQLLIESLLLASAGGAFGLLIAQWGGDGLLLLFTRQGQPIPVNVRPDLTVLAFTAAVSMVTGLCFGLLPAVRATKVDLADRLKETAASLSPRMTSGKVLVAAQAGFSLILVIGAGLFLRTLGNLIGQDMGFDPSNVLVFGLDPGANGYTAEQSRQVFEKALTELRTVPGVRSATVSSLPLLNGWVNNGNITPDRPLTDNQPTLAHWNAVGAEFFQTMGIPVVLGRTVEDLDISGGRKVAVVNETFASRFLPGGSPLGRRFYFGKEPQGDSWEVIGVVKDAKYGQVRDEAPATAYVPYTSQRGSFAKMTFEVKTAADPLAILPAVRERLKRVDATLPVLEPGTQKGLMNDRLQSEHMFAQLTSLFAGLALLLLAIGLYGTLAYSVSRRTNEIGVRMALGAPRGQVAWMVVKESLVVILCGAAVGVPAALAAARLVSAKLYGIEPNDAYTISVAVAVVLAAGLTAAFLPARRAAGVNPLSALRYE